MPVEILMPALSPTMKEGNLVKWVKKEGEMVKSGDVLAEIETDKATMEVEAVDEGKLARILIPEGTQNVKVNEPIALILEEDEDEEALSSYKKSPHKAVLAASPEAKPTAVQPSMQSQRGKKSPSSERKFASPLAKRLAEQNNIDLSIIEGSGPRQRVIKADVEAALAQHPSQKKSHFGQPPHGVGSSYQDVPVTMMRKVIAQRLTESKQQVPHFYLTVECEIDTLLDMRSSLNVSLESTGVKVSVNDFVIKACAAALQKVPAANASWLGESIRYYTSSDISVAVAIDGGLITPILKSSHLKSLTHLSQEMKELAQRAREGKLKPEEFQGGSFSISNLGMYGIKEFAAVINPPQGAILAVGAGEKRAVIRDNHVKVATLMTCTLSVDHRVIDGAVASEWLVEFKKFIENPLLMLA